MAFGAQPTDSNTVPISSPYVPGTGFVALEGSPDTNTDGSLNVSTPARVAVKTSTTGGASNFHLISAATNNATSIKATAGQVYSYEIYNNTASAKFVKLYNKASAPSPGTDTPVRTIGVPANGRAYASFPHGLAFSTGIALAAVTGIADNNNGSVAASDLSIDLDYR